MLNSVEPNVLRSIKARGKIQCLKKFYGFFLQYSQSFVFLPFPGAHQEKHLAHTQISYYKAHRTSVLGLVRCLRFWFQSPGSGTAWSGWKSSGWLREKNQFKIMQIERKTKLRRKFSLKKLHLRSCHYREFKFA